MSDKVRRPTGWLQIFKGAPTTLFAKICYDIAPTYNLFKPVSAPPCHLHSVLKSVICLSVFHEVSAVRPPKSYIVYIWKALTRSKNHMHSKTRQYEQKSHWSAKEYHTSVSTCSNFLFHLYSMLRSCVVNSPLSSSESASDSESLPKGFCLKITKKKKKNNNDYVNVAFHSVLLH